MNKKSGSKTVKASFLKHFLDEKISKIKEASSGIEFYINICGILNNTLIK